MNLFDIKGKVAIVTGGTGVLGGSMAKGLAKAGVKVGILGRRKENAELIVNEIIKEGGEAIALAADVLDENQLTAARDLILQKWGTINILVNAAGGNMPGATVPPGKTIFDLSIDDYKKVIDLNLMGTVIPTMIFSKVMADKKNGAIVNISSMAAQQAITRVVGYSSSKAAIDNFTKWMSVEMATKYGEGIRVNAIAPGFFIGEQNRKLLTNEDGSLTDRGKTIISKTPMKRFGASDELNGTLIWLCSDASKFITGIVVPVDGGFSAFSGV
jgi:NAD(P)-dependent dehydrogenase (short-subunit alcohol dehydrogenase family)